MTVQLNPEQERVIGQAIHAGLIRVPDDVVAAGVDALSNTFPAKVLDCVVLLLQNNFC